MNNPNFDFLKSKFNVSEELFMILQGLAVKKTLKAGEKTAKQGGMSTKVLFLTSGLMRAVQTLESGKEFTKNIFSPISFVAPFSSILQKKPSLLCYEALTDCKVFEINFHEFLKLSHTNVELSNLYNRVLEYIFIIYEKKQLESMSLNATERYKILKKQIPDIDNLIAQYQIASYLNITPVQLSRIRKAL
ncbi:Crp/Fnr family transcriptional regulator [Psychroserpens luteolus]|uniref:Crp/Fnr family transcriptional regulator n=1 Tax=Psychroserpens luteolus TaxID=2855840 RepID=UPI001E5FA878|nr:Crp/Fnr family transcriptional regulator [Psychroserpens luteolus]MCD2257984.1 Crp/Fnr family transcriptional regulator [Psychroserpens luteolus]